MQPNKPQVSLMGAIIATIQVILIVSVVRALQTSARVTGFPAAMRCDPVVTRAADLRTRAQVMDALLLCRDRGGGCCRRFRRLHRRPLQRALLHRDQERHPE